MVELKNLKIWGIYYYYQMDFNITHICPERNRIRDIKLGIKKNPYKSSTNDRTNFHIFKQKSEELEDFYWSDAVGIGTVAGFNGLRALDFDGSMSIEFINSVVSMLGLPNDYEWVVKSGSDNGFHIIFYCDNFEFAGYKRRLRRYYSNDKYSTKFKCIDFIWFNHLILPPSKHKTNNYYSFLNTDYPTKKPLVIEKNILQTVLFELCYEYGGFNIAKRNKSNYYNIPIIDDRIIINQNEYEQYLKNNVKNNTVNNSEVFYYSKIAKTVDSVYNKEYYKLGLDTIKDLLKKTFSNKDIFEIACGNGYWTNILSKFCKTIKATDINDSCLTEAKLRIKTTNVIFEQVDVFYINQDTTVHYKF